MTVNYFSTIDWNDLTRLLNLVWTNSNFRNALGPGIFQGLDKVLPRIGWRHSGTKFGAKCLLCVHSSATLAVLLHCLMAAFALHRTPS